MPMRSYFFGDVAPGGSVLWLLLAGRPLVGAMYRGRAGNRDNAFPSIFILAGGGWVGIFCSDLFCRWNILGTRGDILYKV